MAALAEAATDEAFNWKEHFYLSMDKFFLNGPRNDEAKQVLFDKTTPATSPCLYGGSLKKAKASSTMWRKHGKIPKAHMLNVSKPWVKFTELDKGYVLCVAYTFANDISGEHRALARKVAMYRHFEPADITEWKDTFIEIKSVHLVTPMMKLISFNFPNAIRKDKVFIAGKRSGGDSTEVVYSISVEACDNVRKSGILFRRNLMKADELEDMQKAGFHVVRIEW
jgi:hypothetical protein